MKKLLKISVRILLVGSLVANSSPGLEAALLSVPFNKEQISFRVNQEKMRLETEAMILQMVASRPLLENLQSFPFLSRLLVFFKGPSFSPQALTTKEKAEVRKAEQTFQAAFPRVTLKSALLSASAILLSRLLGFEGIEAPLIMVACGNFLMFGARALEELMGMMRGPSKDLFDRGVLSLGGYFQVPQSVEIPKDRQIPGFETNDKVRVWMYRGVKDAVMKRDDPVALLFDPLQKMAKQAQLSVGKDSPISPSTVEIHSRFATTGDNGSTLDVLAAAAQPGIAPGHWELRWEADPVRGMTHRYVWVENHYQFNGDLYKTLIVQLKKLIESGSANDAVQKRREVLYAELEDFPVEEVIGNQAAMDHAKQLFSELIQHVEPTGNEEARNRLQRWLGLQGVRIPPGDAPLLALYQDLFYTERMWYPSMRYALFTHVSAPNDALDQNPPIEKMRQWQIFFENAFQTFLKEYPGMTWMPAEDMGSTEEAIQATRRLAHQSSMFHKYLRELIMDSSMTERPRFFSQIQHRVNDALLNDIRDTLGNELDVFLKAATTAFWRNTLAYTSIREIKPRFKGTVGGTNLSTLNPPGSPIMNITTANGQGIVFAVSKDGTVASITSDRRIQQQLPDDLAYDAIMLDDTGNESLAVGMNKNKKLMITLYRGPDSLPMSEEELRNTRLQPLRQTEEAEVLVNGNGHGLPALDRVETGIRAAAMQLGVVHENWRNVQQGSDAGALEGKGPPNLQPASEIIPVTIQNRIYEFIRKNIGVNERSLPREMEERIWQKADQLSRDSWDRTRSELDIRKEAQKAAQRIEQELLGESKLRIKKNQLPGVFGEIADLAQQALDSDPREQLSYLKQIAMVVFSAIKLRLTGGRLEEQAYDMVLVGTENSQLAVEKFAQYILGPMLGIRARVISGNEFLEYADRYKHDAPRFMQHFNISSLRTPILLVSDSAETFELGVDSAWAVATVREVFTLTGSRNNRLVDRVRKLRAFTTHNPGSKARDGVKPYVAMLQTFNELGLFWGESVMSRFQTGGSRWDKRPFFQTPFTLADIQILQRSNERFIKDIAPIILGYHASGVEMGAGSDARAKLQKLGLHTGNRQLEMVRWWILEKIELILAPFIGWGINSALVDLNILVPSVMTTLFSYGLGFALSLSLLFGMRLFRNWMGWPAPKLWAGFGAPSFIFADKYRYVYHFWTLYMRTGLGKAFGINSATYYGASINDLIDDYKAVANRRGVVLMGRPGTYHPALNSDDQAAETEARQLKSILNLPFRWLKYLGVKPVGPEILMLGHYTPENTEWWKMSRDMDIDFAPNNRLWVPPGQHIADMPHHLIHYYEDNYGGFGRLLGGIRAMATHIKTVSSHRPTFPAVEFHGGYAVKSTAGPRPGDGVLESVQRRPLKLVRVAEGPQEPSTNPVVILSNPVDMHWLSDLPSRRSGALHSFLPVTRPPTRQPKGAKPQLTRTESLEPSRTSTSRLADVPESLPAATLPSIEHQELVRPAAPAVVVRGLMEADVLEALLSEAESSDAAPIKEVGTSLLLKNKLSRSASTLKWGPIAVSPHSSQLWGTKDQSIPESVLGILDQIIKMALEETPLTKPFILYVDQVPDRAAIHRRSHSPKVAGTITLDADLVEDVLKGVEFAAPTAMLELVEETHELAEDQMASFNRTDLEKRMLLAKVNVFLSLKDDVQLGIIQYLRTHRLFDPKDLELAHVYERALSDKAAYDRDLAQASDASLVRSLENRLEMILLGYVHKAITYEKQPVPESSTESPFLQATKREKKINGRILPWRPWVDRGIASIAALMALLPLRIILMTLVMSLLSSGAALTPQKAKGKGSSEILAAKPILSNNRLRVPQGQRRFFVSPRKGERDLYSFADHLREYPELQEFLAQPGWEERLWNIIGPQSKSGKADRLSSQDVFDVTQLLARDTAAIQKSPRLGRGVMSASLMGLLSVIGVSANAAQTTAVLQHADKVAPAITPLPHLVQWRDTLSGISAQTGIPLTKLLEWNPVYWGNPDRIIANKDIVNLSPASTVFPDPVELASLYDHLPTHVDITPFLHDVSFWDIGLTTVHQMLPYAAWFAVAAGGIALLVWTLKRAASQSTSWSLKLKWGLVTVQILMQLLLPLGSMASPAPALPDPAPLDTKFVRVAVEAVAHEALPVANELKTPEALQAARRKALAAHDQVEQNRIILDTIEKNLSENPTANPLQGYRPEAAVEEMIANYEMSYLVRKLNSKNFVSFVRHGVLGKSARSLIKPIFKPLTASVRWLVVVTQDDKVKAATINILEDAAEQHALQTMLGIQDELRDAQQKYAQASPDEKKVAAYRMNAAAAVNQALEEFLMTPKGSLSARAAVLSKDLKEARQEPSKARAQLANNWDIDQRLEAALGQKPEMLTWADLPIFGKGAEDSVVRTQMGVILDQVAGLGRQEMDLAAEVNAAPAVSPEECIEDIYEIARLDAARRDLHAVAVEQAASAGLEIKEVVAVPPPPTSATPAEDVLKHPDVMQFLAVNRLVFSDPQELLGLSQAVNIYSQGVTLDERAQDFIGNLSAAGTLIQAQAKTRGQWMAISFAIGQALKSFNDPASALSVSLPHMRELMTQKQLSVDDAVSQTVAPVAAVPNVTRPTAAPRTKVKAGRPVSPEALEQQRRKEVLKRLPTFSGTKSNDSSSQIAPKSPAKTRMDKLKSLKVFPRDAQGSSKTNAFVLFGLLGVSAPAFAIPEWVGWIGLGSLVLGFVQVSNATWKTFKNIRGWNRNSQSVLLRRAA